MSSNQNEWNFYFYKIATKSIKVYCLFITTQLFLLPTKSTYSTTVNRTFVYIQKNKSQKLNKNHHPHRFNLQTSIHKIMQSLNHLVS